MAFQHAIHAIRTLGWLESGEEGDPPRDLDHETEMTKEYFNREEWAALPDYHKAHFRELRYEFVLRLSQGDASNVPEFMKDRSVRNLQVPTPVRVNQELPHNPAPEADYVILDLDAPIEPPVVYPNQHGQPADAQGYQEPHMMLPQNSAPGPSWRDDQMSAPLVNPPQSDAACQQWQPSFSAYHAAHQYATLGPQMTGYPSSTPWDSQEPHVMMPAPPDVAGPSWRQPQMAAPIDYAPFAQPFEWHADQLTAPPPSGQDPQLQQMMPVPPEYPSESSSWQRPAAQVSPSRGPPLLTAEQAYLPSPPPVPYPAESRPLPILSAEYVDSVCPTDPYNVQPLQVQAPQEHHFCPPPEADLSKTKGVRGKGKKRRLRQSTGVPASYKDADTSSDEEYMPGGAKKGRRQNKRQPLRHVNGPRQLFGEEDSTQPSTSNAAANRTKRTSTTGTTDSKSKGRLRPMMPKHYSVLGDTLDYENDDSYVYCDRCKKMKKSFCDKQDHAPVFVPDAEDHEGDPSLPKARRSVRAPLSVGPSKIKGAGLGVWTERDLPHNYVFGPYQGKIVSDAKEADFGGYSWTITNSDGSEHFIDASDENDSNWMRYVNCARYEEEQNLVAFQYHGRVYYRLTRPALAFTELLVYYGGDYGETLRRERLLREGQFDKPKEVSAVNINWHAMLQDYDGHDCRCCGKQCGKKSDRVHHEYAHTKQFPYACLECGERFQQPAHLRSHSLVHTGEKPFTCDVCGAAFTDSRNLTRHRLLHTGAKNHVCTQCNRAFSEKQNLDAHVRTHTGEKPFQCRHCTLRFNVPCNRKRHEAAVHGPDKENVLTCGCGGQFANKQTLTRHQKEGCSQIKTE